MKPIQLALAALFAPGVLAEDGLVSAPPRQGCSLVNLNDCFVNDRGTLRAQHGHASSGGVLTCQCHDGEGGLEETSTSVDPAIKPIGASRIGCFGVRPWTSCHP
ncbi:hypothetical protein C8035_v010082 [Colletotrichum spinosum]|uniref:Cyanovirin-N domain-containing protein n=1 Tax=Colletotrichum spinosum TaxID=1347390 RepID=A0A4V3HSF0_9PEZI|nr:hypothetical protein C8035_v010082 [Colletotrichum spinosum]